MRREPLLISTDAVDLYRFSVEKNWNKVIRRVSENPEECKYIDPASKYTPLHLIVLGRDSANPSGRLTALKTVLSAYSDAALVQDENSGFTPLHLACMIESDIFETIEKDSAVVRLILEYSPKAVNVLSHEGYTPLDLHIIAMSRHRRKEGLSFRRSRKANKLPVSSGIFNSLLEEDILGGVAKPLNLLFECNKIALLQLMADEEANASTSKLHARRQARSSGTDINDSFPAPSTIFSNYWVWEWTLNLLRNDHSNKIVQYDLKSPFNAVHSACQVKDCPIAILMLTIRAYPHQVRIQDDSTGNLPLHIVAGMDTLDPSTISRKSIALSVLVSEYPHAMKVRNKAGKTPLSLALETGTTWDTGVRRLTTR